MIQLILLYHVRLRSYSFTKIKPSMTQKPQVNSAFNIFIIKMYLCCGYQSRISQSSWKENAKVFIGCAWSTKLGAWTHEWIQANPKDTATTTLTSHTNALLHVCTICHECIMWVSCVYSIMYVVIMCTWYLPVSYLSWNMMNLRSNILNRGLEDVVY